MHFIFILHLFSLKSVKLCQLCVMITAKLLSNVFFYGFTKKKKNTHSKYRIFVETLQKKKKLRYQSSNSQELFLKKSLWRKLKMLYQKIEHSWGIILFIY